jgi:hypothetical protein
MEPCHAGEVVDRRPFPGPFRSPQRGHVRPRLAPALEELADRGDRTPFDRADGADLERHFAIVAVAPFTRVAASCVRHDDWSTWRIPHRVRRAGSHGQAACAQHGRRRAAYCFRPRRRPTPVPSATPRFESPRFADRPVVDQPCDRRMMQLLEHVTSKRPSPLFASTACGRHGQPHAISGRQIDRRLFLVNDESIGEQLHGAASGARTSPHRIPNNHARCAAGVRKNFG